MSTTKSNASYGPKNDQPLDLDQTQTITVPSGQQVAFTFGGNGAYNAIVIYDSPDSSGKNLSQSHMASTALETGDPNVTMNPFVYTRAEGHLFVTAWALTKDGAWVQIPSSTSGARISFTYSVQKSAS